MTTELISLADDDQERFDDYLAERGWGDGLPAIAPTPARVEAMLAGTARSADDELGVMPPRQGAVSYTHLTLPTTPYV